ncbi:MAG: hypothetical protein OK441_05720 [Thaumarchaeota archaeon]|nr:hypothetical protein [Nitrososphaerota archaeon]
MKKSTKPTTIAPPDPTPAQVRAAEKKQPKPRAPHPPGENPLPSIPEVDLSEVTDPGTEPLTLEQTTALIELTRGAHTDTVGRVPQGTMASLVPLGYAVSGPADDGSWYATKKTYARRNALLDAASRAGALLISEWASSGVRAEPLAVPQRREITVGASKKAARGPDRRTITLTTDKNPSRSGTDVYARFEIARQSKTVQDYLDAGGHPLTLHILAKRGLVKLGG